MYLSKNKTLIIILAILALFGVVFGVSWGLSRIADNIKKSQELTYKTEESENKTFKFPSIKSIQEKIQLKNENGITNILLLGISGEDYISGNLADTIMLLSLNTEREKTYLFSLPRDLWIQYDTESSIENTGETWQKINELYRIAGGTEKPDVQKTTLMNKKVQEITGQPIHYSVVIDLEGIKQFIDLVGGIETEEGRKNGEEALFYIQDRSRPGGDFDRMKRQQEVIIAMLKKINDEEAVVADDEGQMEKIIKTYQTYFSSDISIFQFYQMDLFSNELAINNIEMYTITPSQDNLLYSNYIDVNGQQIYTLHPTAGDEDYSKIQEFISNKLE